MAKPLPRDFREVLDDVWSDIRSGKTRLDSSQALAEAWKRWRTKHGISERTVQQRRYAYRKSFENPRKRRRNPKTRLDLLLDKVKPGKHEVTFDTEGYSEKDRQRIIDTARHRGLRASSDGRFILVRDLNPAPTARARRFFGAELSRRRHHKPTKTKLSTRELEKMASKPRKRNPIAVYNPGGLQLIYGRAQIPKVYGFKTSGEHKGKHFVHEFKTDVKIYGLPQGGLMIQSLDGSRLWADERDLDKFDRKG